MEPRTRDNIIQTLFELGAVIAQSVWRRAAGWTARVNFTAGKDIFLSSTASKLALGPTQPPIQWVQGCVFPRGKAAEA
jgi:hypothetical protein